MAIKFLLRVYYTFFLLMGFIIVIYYKLYEMKIIFR